MSRIVAYDFDGVLAVGPANSARPWRFMDGPARAARRDALVAHYAQAARLLLAQETRFYVISARKEGPAVRAASEAWLSRHYAGRWQGLFLLKEGRTLENVVRYKGAALAQLNASDFTEDNRAVVKGLRAAKLKTRIWLYAEGQCVLDG